QTVYRHLPKISGEYDEDLNTIATMEEEGEAVSGADKEKHFQIVRLKKIKFDNTYHSTLRLVADLAAHDNSTVVSTTFLNRNDAASTLAQYKRNHELEKQKQEMNADYDEEEIDRLTQAIKDKEQTLKEATAKVEELKTPLRGMTKFERFEKYLDDGIDLAALTEKETRLLRKDLQIIFQDPYSSLDPRRSEERRVGKQASATRGPDPCIK